ncbi:putative bifunctional diguanylate cyclase/phosphodiesterase [Oceanobacter mangrovi]|uniref:putative bifunctional diguanylate cyclase/phosphodiesterase n=1 Tax=Oceanobacter mangrovi TaxID=2862510 RepID=UPI001C8DAE43|nr:GGDEF and EAL domain-containing protein [Oceanobacter mangrovi]
MSRQHQNLKRKLVMVSLLTTAITMTFSSAAYLWLEYYLTRSDDQQQVATIGRITAAYAAHEILDGHLHDLQQAIQALRAAPNISLGCFYNTDPRLLASYNSVSTKDEPAKCPPSPFDAEWDSWQNTYPVLNGNQPVGTLLIQTTDQQLHNHLRQFIGFATIITIIAMLLGLLAATRLKHLVLMPIRNLSEALGQIAREKDYSIRVGEESHIELSGLTNLFNELLHTVEQEHIALKENEARFRKLAAFSPVGIFQLDNQMKLQYVNQRWRDIHNLYSELPKIEHWFDRIAEQDRDQAQSAWHQLVEQQTSIAMELRLQPQNGKECWVHLLVSPLHDQSGQVIGCLGAVSDISELKAAQLQMETLAFYDPLTGLANRRLFKNRLSKSIKAAQRSNSTLALMFLDMDQFKRVNDSLGHDAGDLLLQEVGHRLSACVRDRDTVSRIGGDEFTILLTDIKQIPDVLVVAEKLLQALSSPIRIKGQEIITSVSIGITLTPQDSSDPNTLMKNADLAMYKAKELGRNNFQFFSEHMNQEILEHLAWEQEIRTALAEKQFSIYYQPKVCLETYQVTGVEALLRWNHPTRGPIAPDRFIPVAEETGQILDIGEWVLQHSCQQIKALIEQRRLPRNTRVAVNLSARQFAASNLEQLVGDVLQHTGLPPANLELEITESTLMLDLNAAVAVMQRLRNTGIRFAIDDFGTGYSSLAYLKTLPIEVLKVDRSFVNDIPEDSNDMAITAAVIAMAHKLGLQVVAEGVESEDQVEFLRRNRCDQAQGYLFSRPLDVQQLEQFLDQTRAMQLSHRQP